MDEATSGVVSRDGLGERGLQGWKKEAEELGISVRELTLRRRPELRELREKLGVS